MRSLQGTRTASFARGGYGLAGLALAILLLLAGCAEAPPVLERAFDRDCFRTPHDYIQVNYELAVHLQETEGLVHLSE